MNDDPFGGHRRQILATLMALAVVACLAIAAAIGADTLAPRLDWLKGAMLRHLNAYFTLIVALILGFCLWLMVGPLGSMRLGPDGDKPDFSFVTWLALMLGAGMGIGLFFWAVAEPVHHFIDNPFMPAGVGKTEAALPVAIRLTLFHWALHPWAIYAVVGMALAFAAYRRDQPLRPSAGLYPFLGARSRGQLGAMVNLVATAGTVIVMATSLAMGVHHLDTALANYFDYQSFDSVARATALATANKARADGIADLPRIAALVKDALPVPFMLIAMVAFVSLFSALLLIVGDGRMLSRLAVFGLCLMGCFALALLVLGPTRNLLDLAVQSLGEYLGRLVELSFWTGAEAPKSGWPGAWTSFYWGWWIALALPVGTFIARISRGRTVREFVAGAVIAPSVVITVWIAVLGGAGLNADLAQPGSFADPIRSDPTQAVVIVAKIVQPQIFGLGIDGLRFVLTAMAVLLIAIYFVLSLSTSVATMAILNAEDPLRPSPQQRAFWALLIGAIAATLLVFGATDTAHVLETIAFLTAVPVSILLIGYAIGLADGLRRERAEMLRRAMAARARSEKR
ncbi:MAG: BCCT family transporter [Alphaproteobacteria bacterium]